MSRVFCSTIMIWMARMPNPPTYSKVNPADTPILTLQIGSDTLPLEKVNDLGFRVALVQTAAAGR
jgi:hypothetical protein